MSQLKHYIIVLEDVLPNGDRVSCELGRIPIGSSNIVLESFWMRLVGNLADHYRITVKPDEQGS